MAGLSNTEQAAVARCAEGDSMVSQVLDWAAVNSGSRNLDGLATIAGILADAYAALPGDVHEAAVAVVLHGVAHQVDEHLIQPLSIGADVRPVGLPIDRDGDPPARRERPDQADHVGDRFLDRHRLG